MSNRTCLLAAAGAALVFCAATELVAQAGPGQRPYQDYASEQNDYPSGNPSRGSAGPAASEPQQQPPRQDATRGPAPAAPQNPPPPPFTLSPHEQADLDRTLDAWEKKNGQIKTFKCDFTRLQYDPVFFRSRDPKQKSSGEIKYVAPDKGLLREKEGVTWTENQTDHKLVTKKLEALEHWASDGKQLYKVDYQQRTVEEIPIPKELQGQGITQGPLPFVFGAKAAELKARYYIRPVTPADRPGEVWLEIRPKYLRDAQNFAKVQVILRTNDMFPTAIEILGTNGTDRDVYMLEPQGFNLPNPFANDFSPSPLGFKHIKNPP